jgi:Zn-dependent protease
VDVRIHGSQVSPIFLGILAVTIGAGFLTMTDSPTAITVSVVVLIIGGWAVSLCLHEFGHAITAYRGGDRSVAAKGYLTLDPRRYTDPLLSLVLPIILIIIGGIPLPGGAVWINRHALRSKGRESLVSFAGPLTNLVFGGVLAVVVAATEPNFVLAAALSYLALLQLLAFVLNMLPVPGLDGYGVIEPYLPWSWQRFGDRARPYAFLVLFALLLALPAVFAPLWNAGFGLFELFGGQSGLAARGDRLFRFWE